jgi:hypothetical protein
MNKPDSERNALKLAVDNTVADRIAAKTLFEKAEAERRAANSRHIRAATKIFGHEIYR